MAENQFQAGRVGRGGGIVRASGVAEGAVPFGVGLEPGTAADQVVEYAGGTLIGFAERDETKGVGQAGITSAPTQYDDGQPVSMLQRGPITVTVAASVTKYNKVAIVRTSGDSGFSVGDIVDEDEASGSGDFDVIENSWFLEDAAADENAEMRIALPSALTTI